MKQCETVSCFGCPDNGAVMPRINHAKQSESSHMQLARATHIFANCNRHDSQQVPFAGADPGVVGSNWCRVTRAGGGGGQTLGAPSVCSLVQWYPSAFFTRVGTCFRKTCCGKGTDRKKLAVTKIFCGWKHNSCSSSGHFSCMLQMRERTEVRLTASVCGSHVRAASPNRCSACVYQM